MELLISVSLMRYLTNKARKTRMAAVERGKKKKPTKNPSQLNPDISSTPFLYLEILWEMGKHIIKTMPLK